MLTREHAIATYRDGRVLPDRLTRKAHSGYLALAEEMITTYRGGAGRTRRDLHRSVQALFEAEPDCPVRRIEAFCKLLDDASEYDTDRGGRAAELRRKVFRLAAPHHPLVREADRLFDHVEAGVKERIAAELGLPWARIERDLYADVPDIHRLKSLEGYANGEALLSRYNVAQVQVALFRARSLTVLASRDFKKILTHAKLARLMHEVRRTGEGRYVIRLEGPATVLRETRRYGAAMAVFLPAILSCEGWELEAAVEPPWAGPPAKLLLSPKDGLKGDAAAPEAFDSSVEESFAKKWGGGAREGWRLIREGGVLTEGQKVFVPDFLFKHEDGREVWMEVVGFWTPEYLKAKAETLRRFRSHPLLLAVQESLTEKLPALPLPAVTYKTALKLQDALDALGGVGRSAAPNGA